MKKIIFSISVALISLSLFAQEKISTSVTTCQGSYRSVDIRDFYTNPHTLQDNPFKAQSRQAPSKPEGFRWIDHIYNLPDYLYSFYERYGEMVSDVLNGNSNSLSDPTLATELGTGQYATDIATINTSFTVEFPVDAPEQLPVIVYNAVRDTANVFFNEIDCFMPYLFLCLSYDYPQAFWIGNNYTWFETYGYRYDYWMQGSKAGTCNVYLEYHANYLIKNPYFDLRIDDFQSDSAVAQGVTLFNDAVDSIIAGMPLTTRYAQVYYLNEWLTTHNCYSTALGNSDSVPKIVWSPMSAIKGSIGSTGPVCEGYARAFKVLCDKIDIPNIIAVGFAKSSLSHPGEAHMWNEVQMDDSLWYGVDVTWNDPVTMTTTARSMFESNDWLLVGKQTEIFGMTFEESHPNSVSIESSSSDKCMFSFESLITDNAFDITSNVVLTETLQAAPVKVYSITGVLIGSFSTIDEALAKTAPGLYIIGNRKMVIK